MPDPIDELRSFQTQGPAMNPLPAAEVRRRGDRLRRRNTALTAAGTVAAAALAISVPFAIADGGGHSDSAPPIATDGPSPSAALPQEVPAEFDLATGINGNDASVDPQVQDSATLTRIDLCGNPAFDADENTVDQAGATYETSNEATSDRTLVVYTDVAAARAAFAQLRGAVEACPSQPLSADGDEAVHEFVDRQLPAEESLTFLTRIRFAGEDFFSSELTIHQVARTGNALLVTRSFGAGGGGDDAIVRDEVERQSDLLAPALADLEEHFG